MNAAEILLLLAIASLFTVSVGVAFLVGFAFGVRSTMGPVTRRPRHATSW